MILKAENVSFKYLSSSSKVLDNVSLTIHQDKIMGLMGDSGSGKSTLCKVLSGYITNYEGSVTIDGKEIKDNFNPVQLIFQHPEKTMNPKWKMKKILSESELPSEKVKSSFGIREGWLKRWPNELSGGELQRFSILRALTSKTKFIIADEISTMLDAVTQVQIWTSLIEHCRENKIGVLAVSHDKPLLETLCDEVLYFEDLNKG